MHPPMPGHVKSRKQSRSKSDPVPKKIANCQCKRGIEPPTHQYERTVFVLQGFANFCDDPLI